MAKLVPWNKNFLEKDDIPVAIISLADAASRRITLEERGFPAELIDAFWPACDMRGLPDSELQSYSQCQDIINHYGRSPIAAELGCFFSHRAIIKWLSEQEKIPQIVVFEDDAVPAALNSLTLLESLAENFTKSAGLGKPFICHLGPRPDQWRSAFAKKITRNQVDIPGLDLFDLVDKKAGLWRAHAYIINKEAATRYINRLGGAGFLADDWRFIINQTASRMFFVDPPLFTQDECVDSTIDPCNKREELSKKIDNIDTLPISTFRSLVKCIVRMLRKLFVRIYRKFSIGKI